jgi:hypothetical protein
MQIVSADTLLSADFDLAWIDFPQIAAFEGV